MIILVNFFRVIHLIVDKCLILEPWKKCGRLLSQLAFFGNVWAAFN